MSNLSRVPPVSLAERRRARRGELLAAAIEVIRREGANVTMEEMATAGGISKPILYRHFVDRDGLVAAITDNALEEIGAILDTKLAKARTDEPPYSIRATIDAFFEYVEREPQLYRFIAGNESRRAQPETIAFADQVAAQIADALGHGLVERGLDPSPAAIWGRAIVGMVQTTAAWWTAGGDVTRSQAVDALTDLVWVGMVGSVVATPTIGTGQQRRAANQ
jgi:AcrR family transcriptional regulator